MRQIIAQVGIPAGVAPTMIDAIIEESARDMATWSVIFDREPPRGENDHFTRSILAVSWLDQVILHFALPEAVRQTLNRSFATLVPGSDDPWELAKRFVDCLGRLPLVVRRQA